MQNALTIAAQFRKLQLSYFLFAAAARGEQRKRSIEEGNGSAAVTLAMSANVLSGEVHRHWDLIDAAGSRHVLSLIHDCSSGSRVALLDYTQLPGSFGTTNCVNILFGSTRLPFTLPSTGECGLLKIRRDGVFGFTYHCEVS
jgi:hypothetical protein